MSQFNRFAGLRSARQSLSTERTIPVEKSTQGDFSAMSFYNTLGTAYQFGSIVFSDMLDGSVSNRFGRGTVSSSNKVDYYRFALDKVSTLDVSLTELTANANVRLIRDANNNGRIDSGDTIIGSYNPSNVSESFRANGLGIGNYFLEVAGVNNAQTNYRLDISATAGLQREPAGITGNSPAAAIEISGQLNGNRSFLGSVNSTNDVNDYYRFTLDQAVMFNTRLRPLNSNANLYLYTDTNQNGTLEPDELIGFSAQQGTTVDAITKEVLTPGDYYIHVQKPANSGSTDYRLEVNATPLTKSSQVTVDIHELRALERFDARVPFTNWHQADFYGLIKIDNKEHRFGTFKDQGVVTGLKFTQMVDPNQRFIDIQIHAYDEDGLFNDVADIAPWINVSHIRMRYDTVKQQMLGTYGFSGVYSEGSSISLQGKGDEEFMGFDTPLPSDPKAASINFSVNYNPVL